MNQPSKINTKHQIGALYILRQELAINQKKMAKALGVSKSKVSKLENLEIEMSLREMMRLIYIFDLDAHYVFNLFLVHDFKNDRDLSEFRNLMQMEVMKIALKKKNKKKQKLKLAHIESLNNVTQR
jgi:transcriptional regulator with XRE-family HTH domain